MPLSTEFRLLTCLVYFVGMEYVSMAALNPLMVNESSKFEFSACNNRGPRGPTPAQCEAAYADTNVKVSVMQDSNLSGVQVWQVPETHTYSILALGAAGGQGMAVSRWACGAYVHAIFNLVKGEILYILVGQEGENLCNKVNQNIELDRICSHDLQSAQSRPGGGGGGGGTFVFRWNETIGELIPLLVAGGGGGMPSSKPEKTVTYSSEGRLKPSGNGRNGQVSARNRAGGGGGWFGPSASAQSGFSVAEGAVGGSPCGVDKQSVNWYAHGGFGGGGGSCYGGGGGGGYTGGNATEYQAGQGGSSFVSKDAILNNTYPLGTCEHRDGIVEIFYHVDCPCQGKSWCAVDFEENKQKCLCPLNMRLAPNGLHCVAPDVTDLEQSSLSREMIIAMALGSLAVLLLFGTVLFFVVHRKNKSGRLDRLSNADYQLDRLRSTVGGARVLTEYNPNYDFGGSKCTLEDLREIPRERLTLVKALGQGAFGEVYQGHLSNVHDEPCDLPVAVKTLPALCTDQAEMDFLMEALIMSKFDHPNIVRFIGVCFERHPRFIVLELLEGGDLKTYLRESRPKPDQPSPVTMLDLLKLATDVAQGCHYLEENHFIHRDIAARNCLLTKRCAGKVAKIADFGMARDIYRADYYRKGGKAMLPVKWMPPEAFLDGIFTSKTDVWSFGVLLWEVFSLGYMPYPGRGNQEVMQLVTSGGRLEPPQNCPQCIYHVMNLCWHGIPEERPSFTDIIQHLNNCAQDTSVICSPLPVFHRPPSLERESTVMRPRDSDQTVLTVGRPPDADHTVLTVRQPSCFTPDSADSQKPLICQQSDLEKQANLSGSAQSLDQLLTGHTQERCSSTAEHSGNAFSNRHSKGYDSSYDLSPAGCSDKDSSSSPWQQSMETGPVCVSAQVHKQASESDSELTVPDDHCVNGDHCLSGDSGQSSVDSCSHHSLSHCSDTSLPGSSSQTGTVCSVHASPVPACGKGLDNRTNGQYDSQIGVHSADDRSARPAQTASPAKPHNQSEARTTVTNSMSVKDRDSPQLEQKNSYENIPLPEQHKNRQLPSHDRSCDMPPTRPRSGCSRQNDEGCDSGVVVDIKRREGGPQKPNKENVTL